jgi:hypothetical protein
MQIELFYYPAEADVSAVCAARVGSIQATGDSPSEALDALAEKLAGLFPLPLLGAPAPLWAE